jgi:mannose/fructose/N-acetylgalactosamine-specific phosphotransferase system component IIB
LSKYFKTQLGAKLSPSWDIVFSQVISKEKIMKKILTTIVIFAAVNCVFANTHDAIAQALKAKNVHIEYTKVTGKCDNGYQCSIEEMNITTAQHANGIVDHNNNVTITESEDNNYLSQF